MLPWSEVKSLVDEDGFLWQSPVEFWKHKPEMSDLENEFRAQINLARKKGVRVDYIDTQYMMPNDTEIRPIVESIGTDYGIRLMSYREFCKNLNIEGRR